MGMVKGGDKRKNDKKMMQHKRGISALLVGFVVLCIMICGCVDSKASIIGKWERVDADTTMEIFKDGTLTMVTEDITVIGDYSVVGVFCRLIRVITVG